MNDFGFTVKARDTQTKARVGELVTPHGVIHTPAYVPVGTQATVKSLTPEELHSLGVQLFFVNTYHIYLRPGVEVIKQFGGLHTFMNWQGPLITDSGGFQVFSLGAKRFARFGLSAQPIIPSHSGLDLESSLPKEQKPGSRLDGRDDSLVQLVKITDDGVEFQSHWDGVKHFFTPEKSIEIQHALGADLIIAFDECTPYPATTKYARQALDRTHRWAVRSLEAHKQLTTNNSQSTTVLPQALYGVVQGSVYEELRKESAQFISSLDFDGIAIGGVSVGETKEEMVKVLQWSTPFLPESKPRHLLGVGEIDDVFAAVEFGCDTFDCVQPTRLARMGHVFVGNKQSNKVTIQQNNKFTFDITKNEFEKDMAPIDEQCACYTCTNFSRAYLHHLFRVRELLAYRLATIHNIHFVHELVRQIRESIPAGRFLDLKKQWLYNR